MSDDNTRVPSNTEISDNPKYLNPDWTTYCVGPVLWIHKDITRRDFMKICDTMNCYPEPVPEGGFRYNINVGFKTLRLKLRGYIEPIKEQKEVRPHQGWRQIKEDIRWKWRNSTEIAIYGNQKIVTCLKALYGAEQFTMEELNIWKEVLAKFSIECREMPEVESLKYVGPD